MFDSSVTTEQPHRASIRTDDRRNRSMWWMKALAVLPLFVGTLHLLLGPQADRLLGAELPPAVLLDAVLDSQNRFYGVSFMLYGVLLYLCATDLARYRPVLLALLGCFFAGGLARLVSIWQVGMPTAPVLFLLAVELLVGGGLWWHFRQKSTVLPAEENR